MFQAHSMAGQRDQALDDWLAIGRPASIARDPVAHIILRMPVMMAMLTMMVVMMQMARKATKSRIILADRCFIFRVIVGSLLRGFYL